MDSWKHRQMPAPRRNRASFHHERSHGYADWISRIPRIPPVVMRKEEREKFVHLAQRCGSPPFEPRDYMPVSEQHKYHFSHRARSPDFREHPPYMR